MRKMIWIGVFIGALILLLSGCSGGGRNAGQGKGGMEGMAMDSGGMTKGGTAAASDVYTCPMHPQIIRDKPGNCPICGMALVKKENASRELDSVDLDGLLQPANSYVVSQVPVTTVRTKKQDLNLNVLGRVDYDTRQEHVIAARFSGRIERLYVRYRFQHVHARERIMDIYSPDLVTAQENLLYVVKNDAANTALVTAAKERLLLLGMGQKELNQVIRTGKVLYAVPVYSPYMGHIHEAGGMGSATVSMNVGTMTEELPVKEGMYLERGQAVFKLFNTNRSWVLLDLYPDQAPLVKVGTAVEVTPETAPEKVIRGRIDFLEPVYRAGSRTVTARVYFDNSAQNIPIGSQVKAVIRLVDASRDWLPGTAVLTLGLRKVVLIKEGDGFRAHAVQVGLSANEEVQVLDGLGPGDSVAVNAQYLMDSESFIKTKE
ncbi:MAG TPA: efflux RND transporter periplasmic adaptor subunit [Puia sp.]